ncbi:multiheme c-type cytochrome [Luminiphilus sp.]|nr:multiheme c-type cytochrome [Luminiphilus sp.]
MVIKTILKSLCAAGLLLLSPGLLSSPTFVGNEACASCHETQISDWTDSHHDLAMQEASPTTVLGDFNNATFTYDGTTTTFFKKGEAFWVKTDNEKGALRDYPVAFVFGIYPLQQLLLPVTKGRLNALSIAWDARKQSEGGQRWYHIYENEETVTFESPLHWTGIYHNWNSRCAECHSTNVVKGYDAATREYATTYDQIDVGCEGCHGPGSTHVKQAKNGTVKRGQSAAEMGLQLSLAARGQWQRTANENIAHRVTPLDEQTQVDNCGRCHSRRATLGDYHYGQALLDTHRLSVIESPLYWHDGQIRDEVYVYGSFVQSKMAKAGVVCSNCHNPHSNALVAEGNAVCTQCHKQETYDAPTHHRHLATSTGSACVACHMPSQVYMGVDARRDHSMRIPRPGVSLSTGSPNACTQCHEDRTDSWAYDTLQQWGVGTDFQELSLVKARVSADRGDVRSLPTLESVVTDDERSPLMRASLIEQLGNLGSRQLPSLTAMLLRADAPELRASAVRATRSMPAAQRYLMLRPFITDPVLTIRMEVAQVLAGVPASELRPQDIDDLKPLFEEYLAVQANHLDMPSVQMQLASFWLDRGDNAQALNALEEAVHLNPQLEPAVVNLVDLLRRTGKNVEASVLLETSLVLVPDSGNLWFSQGLHLIRLGDTELGLESLKRAAALEQEGSRHRYVYAVALNDTGAKAQALSVLESLNASHPGQPDILNGLLAFARDAGDRQRYERYRAQLVSVMQATEMR